MSSASSASLTPATPAAGRPDAEPAAARRLLWMWLAVLAVLAVLAIAAAWWLLAGRFHESTDDAYVGGNVTVMAPRVGGYVAAVAVHDNQFVKAGQVLVQLDSRDYDAHLAQADADVGSARAAVNELQAKRALQLAVIDAQAADARSAGAEYARSAKDQARYRALVADQAVSDQLVERANADLLKARAAVEGNRATLVAAQRQLAVLDAQIADAVAHVATAEAARRVAALNLEYTTLRAPVDGYVGNRTARVGLLADAGAALMTIVPAQGLWVDANFKEDQLKHMRVGDAATVSFDAASGTLHGVVESLAPATVATFSVLPAENSTGNFTKIVQRIPVRIRLDAGDSLQRALRPGLSATVDVDLRHGDAAQH